MSNLTNDRSSAQPDALFERIVAILEEARGNLVRAVNTQMVTAYWLIGREIVEEIQGGEERATYGKQVIESLSARLRNGMGKVSRYPISRISDSSTKRIRIGAHRLATRRVTNLRLNRFPPHWGGNWSRSR